MTQEAINAEIVCLLELRGTFGISNMKNTLKVITYIEPHTGARLNVCQACQVRTPWPKTAQGREYCQVSMGLHAGSCDICSTHGTQAGALT